MDHALGCLLGVCVGDAAGASLERTAFNRIVSENEAKKAMHMPGLPPMLGNGQVGLVLVYRRMVAKGARK